MSNVNRRFRRGSVPVEYVFLASLLGAGIALGVAFPGLFADLMIQGANNMELGRDNDGIAAAAEPDWEGGELPADPSGGNGGEPPDGWDTPGEESTEPSTDPSGEDPWDDPGHNTGHDNKGCNQGVGNGAEGCDPGNSNHNQPSNDEPGGGRGNGKKYRYEK